jgi:hypothetical protein
MIYRNAQIPADRRIQFRMGVNVGDVVEGTSIHGDGINVAARLEALAEAGGICASSRVQEDAKGSLGRLGVAFENLGQHQLKNIDHAVQIYRVLLDHAATTVKPKQALTPELALPDKPSVAVLPFANLSSDPEQQYSRAMPALCDYVSWAPKHRSGHIWLAATQAQLGQVEDAREQTAVVLRLQPDFTISKTGRRLDVFKVRERRRAFL